MKLNRQPLTAKQYLDKCQNIRNRQACKRIEFREACFRVACYSIALGLLAIAGGCFIQSIILLVSR